jgi:hypothetical protein
MTDSTLASVPASHRSALSPVLRPLELRAGSWNEAARTVDVVFSTGARVTRFDWSTGQAIDEELELTAGAVRLDRLNAGGPVLNAHGAGSLEGQIGSVVPGSARIESGRAVATLRLSARDDVAGLVQDIRDGIIRNISVGYVVHRYAVTEPATRNERPLWRAVDWEPFEISFVPIPADPAAQSRSAPLPISPERTDSVTTPQQRHLESARAAASAAPSDSATVSASQIATSCRAAGVAPEATAELLERHASEPLTRGQLVEATSAVWNARAAAEATPHMAFGGGVTVTRDAGDTLRAGLVGYLSHRLSGRSDPSGPERQFLGLTLAEVLRHQLVESGVREARHWSKHQLVERSTHVSSDFPALLQQAGNRFLIDRFRDAESPLKRVMRIREVPDFKQISEIALDGPATLALVPEGGEVPHGTFTEKAETGRVQTFARAFIVSRQMLINDDLMAFAGAAQMMANAAAATEAAQIAGMLTQASGDGPILPSDGVRLFSTAATRGNKAVSGAALSVTSLGAASAAMRDQRHLDGATPTNARPRFLVVGSALEVPARQLVASVMVPNQTSSVNPFAGELETVVDARMTGNSWRLFADPALFPVLTLAYLEGRTAPEIESFDTITTLGVHFRCVFDFTAYAVDWRGSYLNPGA